VGVRLSDVDVLAVVSTHRVRNVTLATLRGTGLKTRSRLAEQRAERAHSAVTNVSSRSSVRVIEALFFAGNPTSSSSHGVRLVA